MARVPDGGEQTPSRPPRSDAELYLRVAAPIFFGLFFVEYLPLFAVGYWSWSGAVHKILSGAFLLLNLGIAEYSVRRSRSRSRATGAGDIAPPEKSA
ncbi:MAG: hypothetical protein OK441_05300 [Thaumarchaeota archaeon]|nr:hypothetical protein [Nitrososphaerota archaeon]